MSQRNFKMNIRYAMAQVWNCLYPLRKLLVRTRRGVYGTPILCYHSVWSGLDQPRFRVSIDEFDRQIRYLMENFHVVSLGHYVECILQGKALDNAVVVTFDDGYEDNYTNAFPILEKYGCPATIFVVTGFLDEHIQFEEDGEVLRPLSWGQIIEMGKSGLVTFGAHTHSHRMLTNLDLAEVETEIDRCRCVLQDRLNLPIEHFCYPSGKFNVNIENVVRMNGYLSACSSIHSIYNSQNTLFRLNRIIIDNYDAPESFILKLSGAYDYLFIYNKIKNMLFP